MKNRIRLFKNGYLIVEDPPSYRHHGYQGVYGLDWSLKDKNIEFSLNLDIPLEQGAVEVATNWEAVLEYWQLCKNNSIDARLLLIETPFAYPVVTHGLSEKWKFVSFDVADITVTLYSAIQQELLAGTAEQLMSWKRKLNKNRLFDTYHDAEAFIKYRWRLASIDTGIESCGHFVPIRISRYMDY